jgi:multicomponent Na+:H+ antiporter subunit E
MIWMLLNWPLDAARFMIGILAAGFVTYVTGDMFAGKGFTLKDLRRPFFYFFCYVPLFFAGMIRASLFVAWRILHPNLPICPGIVRIKTSLKNNIALTCLANSLTLTSGVMTVDVDPDHGILYVHCIDVRGQEVDPATKWMVDRMEPIIKNIFE